MEHGNFQKVNASRIAKTWTNLVAGFVLAEEKFTPAENAANDAILMQIQGALLALGLVPVGEKIVVAKPEYLPQLIPNTSALAKYLYRKRRENPQIAQFRNLYQLSKNLAQQIELTSQTISVTAIRSQMFESPRRP